MTLNAHRKNLGKQYTVVSPEDRVIRHWHRPGDPLPVIVTHAGKKYLLTADVVEQARVSKRSPLVLLKVDAEGKALLPAPDKAFKQAVTRPTYYNGKATEITPVDEEINWKAVAITVGGLLLAGVIATSLVLGA